MGIVADKSEPNSHIRTHIKETTANQKALIKSPKIEQFEYKKC